MREEHKRDVTLAWHTAAFYRIKSMPRLDELLEHFDSEEERKIKFSRRLRQAYEQIDARNRAVAMMKEADG